ncbi:MAG: EAL domain-containing protein [Desulfuromonadales bacterium]|nr:EAL domain-containing protein [Chloroflexota bacterium]MCK4620772.1 EAL domain-containing protein [Desulfuromonadales bacterium]
MLIKQKIQLTTLALFIIPVIVIGLTSYYLAEDFLLKSRQDSLAVVAQLKAEKIEDFIKGKQCSFYEIRGLDSVRNSLGNYVNQVKQGGSKKVEENLLLEIDKNLSLFQDIAGLDGIIFADAQGRVFYLSNLYHREKNLHTKLPLTTVEIAEIYAKKIIKIIFVQNDHEHGEDHIFLIGPVMSKQGEPLALMGFEVGLSSIYAVIEDSTGLGKTGKTILGKRIDENHFIHLNPFMRSQERSSRHPVLFKNNDELMPLQEAVLGRSGSGICYNCQGVEIIASWSYLPRVDLGLVAKMDLQEAYASIAPFKQFTIIFIIGVVGLGLMIVTKISHSASIPIQRLQIGTRRVGQGDFSCRLPVDRNDEFGQLAEAFNNMTENLLHVTASRDQLNLEIAERSAAEKRLSESEQRLRELFDSANDLIQSVSADGRILFVNQAWLKTLGYTMEEIPQLNIFDIIHPDYQNSCLTAFQEAEQKIGDRPLETAFVTKDGRKIELEGNVSFQLKDGRAIALRGIFRDITDRKRAEKAVAAERTFLQTIIDGVEDPIYVIDLDYQVRLMNLVARDFVHGEIPATGTLPCYRASHNMDQPCRGINHPCPLQQVKETGQSVTVIHTHVMEDGKKRVFELVASPFRGEDGSLQGIIESFRDITERLKAEEALLENEKRLNFLAHHDPLTSLPNRVLFNERLAHALTKTRRSDKKLGLLFLDLDRFKNINDSLGHAFGDQVLKTVADRLEQTVRAEDTVARLGGDEFLIILEEVNGPQAVASLAQKVLTAFAAPVEVLSQELSVTVSIGIGMYPADGHDSEELLKCADVAMYGAKKGGGNRFQFYTPDMNAKTHELLLLERDLSRALSNRQFDMYYQPQVDLRTCQLIGLEALVRWQHPEKGLICPSDFIPLAEETGFIVALGEWILETSCRQAKQWLDAGYALERVCVNISGRQFRHGNLVQMVDATLKKTGLEPRFLELEITESVIMDDVEETISTLTALKERNISLAIDDFGTGYSSLSYLKRFPISKLKIDRSFVRDITSDVNDAAIAKIVVALARSLGVGVVAEGIETAEQLQMLLEMNCFEGQGYLFSKPAPAEKIVALLARTSPDPDGAGESHA